MKKYFFITIVLLNSLIISAQKGKIVSAINYIQNDDLLKAKEMIDSASVNEKTKEISKTWFVKGRIYESIYESQKAELLSIANNSLDIAYKSFMKAIEIDKDNYNKEMTPYLIKLRIDFLNKGITSYNAQKFDDALASFDIAINIDKIPAINIIDTSIIYTAGISAHYAKKYNKAIEYYDQAIKYDFKKLNSYIFKIDIYKTLNDSVNFRKTLNEAISYFPDNESLVIEMVNNFLNSGNAEQALNYINKLIEKNSGNATYYFAQGTLYDKIGKLDMAQASYEKAIGIKPDYIDANYNLGAIYYNKAAKVLDQASNIPLKEQDKFNAEKEKANNLFRTALPYFEKAYSLNNKDVNTLQTLSVIYTKLQMTDKAKEINDTLKGIK